MKTSGSKIHGEGQRGPPGQRALAHRRGACAQSVKAGYGYLCYKIIKKYFYNFYPRASMRGNHILTSFLLGICRWPRCRLNIQDETRDCAICTSRHTQVARSCDPDPQHSVSSGQSHAGRPTPTCILRASSHISPRFSTFSLPNREQSSDSVVYFCL